MISNNLIILLITLGLLKLINSQLTLSKDANDKFYYTINGQDYPVDLDIGSEIAGLQEKAIFPRDTKDDKTLNTYQNVKESIDLNKIVKRSAKHKKQNKKIIDDKLNKDKGESKLKEYDINEAFINEDDNIVANNINPSKGSNHDNLMNRDKSVVYDYVEDDVPNNMDNYDDEKGNENDNDNVLSLASKSTLNRNHHRFDNARIKSDRHQQQHYSDEYYEDYEDDSANRKSNRMGKSRHTRYDVIRR